MLMIPYLNRFFGRPAQTLAVGLVLLAMVFLAACTDDEDAQPAAETQPAATSGAASGAGETPQASRPPVQVVSTSNIVGDWARVVGGDRVEVFSLHSPGADPHNLVPGARDVAKVAEADIVLSIGLGLETEWLEDLIHDVPLQRPGLVADTIREHIQSGFFD